MWQILLFVFGTIGITKGEFKITKNLRVSGSTGRTLGAILLIGGLLSFVDGLLGMGTLALVIFIGLVKAEKIDAAAGPSSRREMVVRIAIAIGVIVFIVLGPIAILTLFGPAIGQVLQSIQGN